jgi:glycine betaine/proline transport system substrate-binding protein
MDNWKVTGKWFFNMRTVAILALVAVLALGACGDSDDADDEPVVEKMTVGLIQGNWSSQMIMTEIADQVISNQLGYETTRLVADVTPGWAAICNEEAHLAVEAWLPSRLPEIQPFIDKGCFEMGGSNFAGSIGWFVPRYMVEGDGAVAPGLKTVADLNDYWELFENPEHPGMGELIGGEVGWIDQPQDISRIAGYDLNYYRSNQGEAVILSLVKSKFLRKDPFLTYLWTPHSIFGEVDLVQLEEPGPYVEGECFVEENVPYQCAHPAFDVHTVLSPALKVGAPDAYNFINNMTFGELGVSDLMYQTDVLERDFVEVASEWIVEHQAEIDEWIKG